jgi:hypothetical protein
VQILFIAKSLPVPEVGAYVIRSGGLLERFVRRGDVAAPSDDVCSPPAAPGPTVREAFNVPAPA